MARRNRPANPGSKLRDEVTAEVLDQAPCLPEWMRDSVYDLDALAAEKPARIRAWNLPGWCRQRDEGPLHRYLTLGPSGDLEELGNGPLPARPTPAFPTPAPPDVVSPAARLDTLPTAAPALTLGYSALEWAVKYLVQTNGPREGHRYSPTPRQVVWWMAWYSVRDDWMWCYHHGANRLAKSSGKSPMAAVSCLMEMCAPVRVDRIDPNAPGGVVGKPVSTPWVQIAAVSEAQTRNTAINVKRLIGNSSILVDDHELESGERIWRTSRGGIMHVVTSSASTAEGAELTFACGDETMLWTGPAGADFMATLRNNCAKSGNRMIETCNAWAPGSGSCAERTFDAWCEQEERLAAGRQPKSGSRILYNSRMAPPDTDMSDPESLTAALEFVYADCAWAPIGFYSSSIYDKTMRADESARKFLNWNTAVESAWCHRQDWQAMAAPDRELDDGEQVVLFFDGSKSRDATALIGCCLEDGHIFTAGVWEPKQDHNRRSDDLSDQSDTAQIDYTEVDAVVAAMHERFQVVAFWADVREFESFVNYSWPKQFADQYDPNLWAAKGGQQPSPIAWDMRSGAHSYRFSLAAEETCEEIAQHAFTHDGNPVLERHVMNCRRTETSRGVVTVGKESRSSPLKIDACVTMIGARMLYRTAAARPEEEPEEPCKAMFVNRFWG